MSLKQEIKILKSKIMGQKPMLDSAKHEIEKFDKHKLEIFDSFINQHKNESEIKDKIISNLNEELKIKSIVKQCTICIEI